LSIYISSLLFFCPSLKKEFRRFFFSLISSAVVGKCYGVSPPPPHSCSGVGRLSGPRGFRPSKFRGDPWPVSLNLTSVFLRYFLFRYEFFLPPLSQVPKSGWSEFYFSLGVIVLFSHISLFHALFLSSPFSRHPLIMIFSLFLRLVFPLCFSLPGLRSSLRPSFFFRLHERRIPFCSFSLGLQSSH